MQKSGSRRSFMKASKNARRCKSASTSVSAKKISSRTQHSVLRRAKQLLNTRPRRWLYCQKSPSNLRVPAVRIGELECEGKEWKMTAEADRAALERATAEFASQRQILSHAATSGSQELAKEMEQQARQQQQALQRQGESSKLAIKAAADCVKEFELHDKRLRVALAQQQHELRLCRAHLVNLVHASSGIGHFSMRIGGGYRKVADVWQTVRAFVAESKWGQAQKLLSVAKSERDFPMLPAARLVEQDQMRDAKVPKTMSKLLSSMQKERDDDAWHQVLDSAPPTIPALLRDVDDTGAGALGAGRAADTCSQVETGVGSQREVPRAPSASADIRRLLSGEAQADSEQYLAVARLQVEYASLSYGFGVLPLCRRGFVV